MNQEYNKTEFFKSGKLLYCVQAFLISKTAKNEVANVIIMKFNMALGNRQWPLFVPTRLNKNNN